MNILNIMNQVAENAETQIEDFAEHIEKVSEDIKHTVIGNLLKYDPMEDFGEPGSSDELFALSKMVAFQAGKSKILELFGDTTHGTKAPDFVSLAVCNGFEVVKVFEFFQLDDRGFEDKSSPGGCEAFIVLADYNRNLILTIETNTWKHEDGTFEVSVNNAILYFAWQSTTQDRYPSRASGSLDSQSNPNWRNGEAFQVPDDLVFTGHADVRVGFLWYIKELERTGKLVEFPKVKEPAFGGSTYGVNFYTDYKRAEFLDASGQFDFRNSERLKALRDSRLKELPERFLKMAGY